MYRGCEPGVEHDRDRPVVDQLDRHSRPEGAGLDRDADGAQPLAEQLVQRLGLLRAGSVREARPVPLAGVSNERELAHHERGAADVAHAEVEAAGLVLEDPQASDPRRKPACDVAVVSARDAEENAEAVVDLAHDLAGDDDAGTADPLDDGPHGLTLRGAPQAAVTGSR
jgi:hypothetical protein